MKSKAGKWDGISSDLSSNFIQYWGFCIRLFRNYRRHEVVAQLSIYDLRWHNLLGNYSEAVLIKQCSWTSSRSLIMMTVVDGKYSWYKLLGQGKRDICGKIASKMFLKHFLGLLRPVSECNCGIIFVTIFEWGGSSEPPEPPLPTGLGMVNGVGTASGRRNNIFAEIRKIQPRAKQRRPSVSCRPSGRHCNACARTLSESGSSSGRQPYWKNEK